MPPPARGLAPPIAALLCVSLLLGCVRAKIGYFWHVTDLHFDDLYQTGGDPAQSCHSADKRAPGRAAGRFGDEACDAPWALVESAARAMQSKQAEVEFVLWTGDSTSTAAMPRGAGRSAKEKHMLRNLTALLSQAFSGQFVFPALGHSDPAPHPAGVGISSSASRRPSSSSSDDFSVAGVHHGHGVHGGGRGSGGGGGGGSGVRGGGASGGGGGTDTSTAHAHRPYEDLADMWQNWLPPETEDSFETGGYYSFEQKPSKLRLVVLNTNLFSEGADEEAANKQWRWLERTMKQSESSNAVVYLVGHAPPGVDERRPAPPAPFGHTTHADVAGARLRYSPHANRRYLDLVRRHAPTIAGQFFGHLHSDSFRVFYDDREKPISWALVAPSVTPRRVHHSGANNPGLRLVKFNTETGDVLDYAQYYLDLAAANERDSADWALEYNFSSYYMQDRVSAEALHVVAHSFTQNMPVFKRYLAANSVKLPTTCNDGCYLDHYCAMTKVDYDEFTSCVTSAASALASANPSTRRQPSPLLTPLLLLLLQLAAGALQLQLLRPLASRQHRQLLPPPHRSSAAAATANARHTHRRAS